MEVSDDCWDMLVPREPHVWLSFLRLSAVLQVRIFFEYVESASNWSDGVSRELAQDSYSAQHGFVLKELKLPEICFLLRSPLAELFPLLSKICQ